MSALSGKNVDPKDPYHTTPLRPEEMAEILRLRLGYWPIHKIAKHMDRSRKQISYFLLENGLINYCQGMANHAKLRK